MSAEEPRQLFGRAALVNSYRRCFDSADGQIVLKHLIRKFHVLDSTFVAGDPHLTSMQEGERRVVLAMLKWARKDYNQIMADLESQMNEREDNAH